MRFFLRPIWIATAVLLAILSLGNAATAQSFVPTENLSFGAFVGGTGGTITISPAGIRTAGGDVSLMTIGRFSQGSAASFELTGGANATYEISLPDTATLIGSQGGSMPISAFTSAPQGEGQLSPSGNQTVYVGATLGVANNQVPGSYSGNFSVTAVFE